MLQPAFEGDGGAANRPGDGHSTAGAGKSNPAALRELTERLLEAIQRDLWSGDDDGEREKLEELLLEMDEGLESSAAASF